MRMFVVRGYVNRNLGIVEGGDGIRVDGLGYDFLLSTVFQVKAQLIGRIADQGAALRQGDFGRRGIAYIGQKYSSPQRLAVGGNRVLHIQHNVLEVLVEDARLDLE